MLVLGFDVGQKAIIEVPPSASPTVLEVVFTERRADRVRIGFTAPREVKIDREKVREAKQSSYVPGNGRGRSGRAHVETP